MLEQPFITLQRPSTVRVMLEEHLGALQMKLPVALESHQLATVGKMVASGLGVSAVPSVMRQADGGGGASYRGISQRRSEPSKLFLMASLISPALTDFSSKTYFLIAARESTAVEIPVP